MDHQVDGPAATAAAAPVDEFGAGHGEHALGRMPLVGVVRISAGTPDLEHRFQRHGPQVVGPLAKLRERHGSEIMGERRVTHPFRLNTWLFSVSRSMSAAER